MRTLVVIPARYGSTRFPGKPLADLAGKPMVWHVYERAVKAEKIQEVVVATDDERIVKAVASLGGNAVLTSPSLASGTERVRSIAKEGTWDIVINLQGDEPLIDPRIVDQIVETFIKNENVAIATAAVRSANMVDFEDRNVVKVVTRKDGNALYFSRSPIPYRGMGDGFTYLKHIGIYGFRAQVLRDTGNMGDSDLEKAESLEQLKWMDYGYDIKIIEVDYDPVGVDTPHDLEIVKGILDQEGERA